MPEITEAERQERLKELFRLLAEEQEHWVDVGGGVQARRVDDDEAHPDDTPTRHG